MKNFRENEPSKQINQNKTNENSQSVLQQRRITYESIY